MKYNVYIKEKPDTAVDNKATCGTPALSDRIDMIDATSATPILSKDVNSILTARDWGKAYCWWVEAENGGGRRRCAYYYLCRRHTE